jgi:hypothetical protein
LKAQLVLLRASIDVARAPIGIAWAPINLDGMEFRDDDFNEYLYYLFFTFGTKII